MKKIFLYLTVFVVVFIGVLVVVKSNNEKRHLDNSQNAIYGDQEEYVFYFDEKTIENRKIVAFDNVNRDFIRYYVIEFSGNKFVSYNYYFLKDSNQYMDVYSENISKIVDYNYNQLMIKTLESFEEGTYDEVINNVQHLIDDNSVYLVY